MPESLADRIRFELHKKIAAFSYGVVHYRHPMRRTVWLTATEDLTKIPTVTLPVECMELFQAVVACEKIPGDMAEAGVYRGGTAAIMLKASRKRLHLFDTFEGLPHGDIQFQAGEYPGSQDDVKRNLCRWIGRVEFHPGLFPASTAGVENVRFSFVHLDLDLYESTKAALEWFWPRMNLGAILLSHDYPFSDGVVRAFHEFFDTRTEPFLPLSGNQCVAVKTRA